MSYKLFLDDVREPKMVFKTTANHDWITVRDYDGFVKTIEKKGLPFMVSFDHDLADVHYEKTGSDIDYNGYREKTGYHAAQWLVTYCLDRNVDLPKWNVHSANPVGRENIESFLNSYEKYCDSAKSAESK